jgi:hypothetical protein
MFVRIIFLETMLVRTKFVRTMFVRSMLLEQCLQDSSLLVQRFFEPKQGHPKKKGFQKKVANENVSVLSRLSPYKRFDRTCWLIKIGKSRKDTFSTNLINFSIIIKNVFGS